MESWGGSWCFRVGRRFKWSAFEVAGHVQNLATWVFQASRAFGRMSRPGRVVRCMWSLV